MKPSIPEPTDLRIGIAHKGFSCAEIIVHGRAAHGSRPLDGRDAIMRMGRVLTRLEALDARLQAGRSHPLLGTASLHAGTIRGGTELSVYPADCVLQVERRTLPGEQTDVALKEVTGIATDLAAADPEFSFGARLVLARPPYATPSGASVTDSLADAVRARMGVRPLAGLELLDRRRDSRRRGYTDGALRPTWCGPAQHRGVRGSGGRAGVPRRVPGVARHAPYRSRPGVRRAYRAGPGLSRARHPRQRAGCLNEGSSRGQTLLRTVDRLAASDPD